jgi:hypothetical protein
MTESVSHNFQIFVLWAGKHGSNYPPRSNCTQNPYSLNLVLILHEQHEHFILFLFFSVCYSDCLYRNLSEQRHIGIKRNSRARKSIDYRFLKSPTVLKSGGTTVVCKAVTIVTLYHTEEPQDATSSGLLLIEYRCQLFIQSLHLFFTGATTLSVTTCLFVCLVLSSNNSIYRSFVPIL